MLQEHLEDLEQAELHRFRSSTLLDEHSDVLQRAKAVGAAEVYRHLLTMDEEDLNDELETGRQQDYGADGQG